MREGTELQTKFNTVHFSNKNKHRGSVCGGGVQSGCGGGVRSRGCGGGVRSGGCAIEDLTLMVREVGRDNMYG